MRDDELADAIHQLVETFGRNADILGRLRLADGGRRLALGRNRLDRTEFRDGRRRRNGRRRCRGDRRRGCLFIGRSDGCRCRPVDLLDTEFHVIEHEDEDVVDRRTVLLAGQRHVPGNMEIRRNQLVESRNGRCIGAHGAFAEIAQLVQQTERVGAVGHRIGGQAEADAPAVLLLRRCLAHACGCGNSDRRGGRRRFLAADGGLQLCRSLCPISP